MPQAICQGFAPPIRCEQQQYEGQGHQPGGPRQRGGPKALLPKGGVHDDQLQADLHPCACQQQAVGEQAESADGGTRAAADATIGDLRHDRRGHAGGGCLVVQ